MMRMRMETWSRAEAGKVKRAIPKSMRKAGRIVMIEEN
jgi:hypothetical protein